MLGSIIMDAFPFYVTKSQRVPLSWKLLVIIGSVVSNEQQNGNLTDQSEVLASQNSSAQAQVSSTKKYNFLLNEADFEKLVEDSFMKIINGELEKIKFPHTLSVQQKKIVHPRAENCGINTKSDGTRYRVLYLFQDNREVQKQSVAQIISSQLQEVNKCYK